MNRRHWEPDHPAVMGWAERNHKRHARQVEWSVAYRRRQAGERARQARLAKRRARDWRKIEALAGLTLLVGAGFAFDYSERNGQNVWTYSLGMLFVGGLLWVDAIRRCDESHR